MNSDISTPEIVITINDEFKQREKQRRNTEELFTCLQQDCEENGFFILQNMGLDKLSCLIYGNDLFGEDNCIFPTGEDILSNTSS